jgi:hypothetical protein
LFTGSKAEAVSPLDALSKTTGVPNEMDVPLTVATTEVP